MSVIKLVGAVVVAVWSVLLAGPVPSASAQPCPDVEVIFARGTAEPPGVGGVGQAFVDALRSQAGSRSVGVYPVNYPASADFADPMAFAATVVEGIRDAGAHIQSTAATCPNTRMVVGGYSQGAAVAGFVTSAEVPPEVPAALVPTPMPLEVADHVAAVALFRRMRGPASTARRRLRSARPMRRRPSSCALRATRSATAQPEDSRASPTRCTR